MIDQAQESVSPYKRCIGPCKRILPATVEYFQMATSHGNARRKIMRHICKECRNLQNKDAARRRKENVVDTLVHIQQIEIGTPDQCGSCGTRTGNIFGDVDNGTGKRYGYLCMKCYRLIGNIRSDPNRIRNVLDYVERVSPTQHIIKKAPTSQP